MFNHLIRKYAKCFISAVFTMIFIVSLQQTAYADYVTPPRVPSNIQVPAGNKVFLMGHAAGTQDYICIPSPSGSGFAWTFFGPQATLFDGNKKQIITHFLSPNPSENGTPSVAWQHSQDTSIVWGKKIAESSDPSFVTPNDIPWLLIQVVGAKDGPTGGHQLTKTTFIQRVNTSGGIAPSTGCTSAAEVGHNKLVPYKADYFF